MTQARLATAVRQLRHTLGGGAAAQADGELLHAFAACGDSSAFAALVGRYGPLVHGVCRRQLGHEQDAEDAFQATFLTLARQAGSIRKGESLGGWLHGVCYRIAMRAKREAVRRRAREGRVKPAAPANPVNELAWREVQAALDEEVERLPPLYRAAFVLCCLDDVSRAEAARRLGIKEGTVCSRLATARKRLQAALARRGITLSAVLAALSVSAARAAVPRPLADATARAALLFANGQPAALAGTSAKAISLAEGALKTMLATKVKLATVLLLTLSLFGAGAALTTGVAGAERETASEPPARGFALYTGAPQTPPRPPKDPKPDTLITCAGRVLDLEGKPVKGAKVYLLDASPPDQAPQVRATSGADGRFRFSVAKADVKLFQGYVNPWRGVFVVATADGYGPAVSRMDQPDIKEKRTIQLVKDDVPIRGRVLDLQGRPIAGVKVAMDSLGIPNEGDLTAFFEAVKAGKSAYPPENKFLTTVYASRLRHLFPEQTTDKEGRFTLKGVGRERVVGLTISAPTVETRRVRILTRQAETLSVPAWSDSPDGDVFTYHGAQFDHIAALSSPIVGVVRDKDTGKPIPGAVIESYKFAGNNIHGNTRLRTVADDKGRYRLTGMPRGEGNILRASPPDDQPYMMVLKGVPESDGREPVTLDIELKRGVWITGKAVDKATGKPVPGQVEYFAFADNTHLGDYPGFTTRHHRYEFNKGGTFRLVGLPGHGLLAFRAWGDGYLIGVGADKVKTKAERGLYPTRPHPCHAEGYHAFVDLNPDKGTESVRCEVVLDPGRTVTGTLLDPDGKPLAGALARDLRSYSSAPGYWEREPLPTAEFTARAVTPDRPRTLLFLHKGKKLAGALLLKGDEKGPLTVKLQPWGTLTGRVVDERGRPRAGATLHLFGAKRPPGDPRLDVGTHPDREFVTGNDGTFRIEGLVPGMKYSLSLRKEDRRRTLADEVAAGSGEVKNLGDVGAKPR